ncbi:hypothetical protein [Phormidesmis sp. 146-33]
MTRKHQLILFLSPSIGVILAAALIPFVDRSDAAFDLGESLRNGLNEAYSYGQGVARGEAPLNSRVSPSTVQATPTAVWKDPRADVLGHLAYPQSTDAIVSRIGSWDYTQGDHLVYIGPGYSTLRLWKVGDRITGYEVRQQ